MYKDLLRILQAKNRYDSNEVCLSILLPLDQTLPNRKANPIRIKEVLHDARQLIQTKPGERSYLQNLMDALDNMPQRIDAEEHHRGLGIFLGRGVNELIYFPFLVEEKVVIDDSFETRDLVFAIQYMIPYWLLVVNKKKVRLLQGECNDLTEMVDDHFPIRYTEQYQYPDPQRPRQSGDYQDEETQIKEVRRIQFFRHVNKVMGLYLKDNQSPIVLAGVRDTMVSFEREFDQGDQTVARMYGKFDQLSTGQLGHLAYEKIQAYVKESSQIRMGEIEESIGKRGYLYGISAVWRAASEGRADLLLVEKDYKAPAFIDPDTKKLLFNLHNINGLERKIDAVDDVIELILDKRGKVIFLQNGALDQYDHIAVKTRY